MLWRAVVRLDPAQGSAVRQDATFEASNRRSAEELARDDWGRKSLSGHERNRLFLSHRGRQFADLSLLSGADHKADGRAMALLDYNRDGWVDFAVASTNRPSLTLFKNEIRLPRSAIALRLIGGKQSNRDAIGARIHVRTGERSQVRELHAGEGNAAQNSKTLIFGLNGAPVADSVTIRWPSGGTQHWGPVEAARLVLVTEGEPPVLEPYTP